MFIEEKRALEKFNFLKELQNTIFSQYPFGLCGSNVTHQVITVDSKKGKPDLEIAFKYERSPSGTGGASHDYTFKNILYGVKNGVVKWLDEGVFCEEGDEEPSRTFSFADGYDFFVYAEATECVGERTVEITIYQKGEKADKAYYNDSRDFTFKGKEYSIYYNLGATKPGNPPCSACGASDITKEYIATSIEVIEIYNAEKVVKISLTSPLGKKIAKNFVETEFPVYCDLCFNETNIDAQIFADADPDPEHPDDCSDDEMDTTP